MKNQGTSQANSPKRIFGVALAIFAWLGLANYAYADRISREDFTTAAFVDTLNDLAPSSTTLDAHIYRNGFAIDTNATSFVYTSSVDYYPGVGSGHLMPNTSIRGYSYIHFDNSWDRAGIWVHNVGFTNVLFWDSQNNLLGNVYWASGPAWSFIGWEDFNVGISHIWVVHEEGVPTASQAKFSGITWENVVTPVPEPETYAMMLAGLGLIGGIARRRKQKLNA